jgi:hypothetical protein
MTKLLFNSADVWRQLQHAIADTGHSPTIGQKLEYIMRTKGVSEDEAFESFATVDVPREEVPAGLWLVKDDGIYLMSNGVSDRECGEAYAVGFDPKRDQDVWDLSRDAAGGDDFSEFLAASMFPEGPYEDPRTRIVIDLRPDSFELIVSFPHDVHLPSNASPDLSL